MSSSKRARRLGLGLVSGFVTATEFSGSPPLQRRLSLWAAPRHRPDTPWRNTLMSSPRAVKRPAVDFVGFVIWDLYKSQHTICVSRRGRHHTQPFGASYASGVQLHDGIFRPHHDCRGRPVQRPDRLRPPRGSLTARRYDMLMLRVRGERIPWHAPPIAGAR